MQAVFEELPDRVQLAAEQRNAELDLRLKREGLKPVVNAEWSLLQGVDATGSALSVYASMPLFLRRERAQVALGTIELERIALEQEALNLRWTGAVTAEARALADRHATLVAARAAATAARRMLEAETARFEAGESSVFLVIARETAWLEAERSAIDAEAEAMRQAGLAAAGAGSVQVADQARHAARLAREHLKAAEQSAAAALAVLGGDPQAGSRAAAVLQARAQLERARLNTSYTEVLAPSDGVVARVDQLPVGAYLNASQAAFWLLAGRPWVEANYKEDQIARMRVGQPVEIDIEAYPQDKLKGRVASFAPGTGQAFSALPAQNATGNWVKVTQRLPVRIEFDQPPPDMAARAGLSATVKVDVRSSRDGK
jgi:membrane fusion protein (multidrug efflux system)